MHEEGGLQCCGPVSLGECEGILPEAVVIDVLRRIGSHGNVDEPHSFVGSRAWVFVSDLLP